MEQDLPQTDDSYRMAVEFALMQGHARQLSTAMRLVNVAVVAGLSNIDELRQATGLSTHELLGTLEILERVGLIRWERIWLPADVATTYRPAS